MSLLMTPGKLERLLECAHDKLAELEAAHESHARACFEAGHSIGYFNGRLDEKEYEQVFGAGPGDAYDEWRSGRADPGMCSECLTTVASGDNSTCDRCSL